MVEWAIRSMNGGNVVCVFFLCALMTCTNRSITNILCQLVQTNRQTVKQLKVWDKL